MDFLNDPYTIVAEDEETYNEAMQLRSLFPRQDETKCVVCNSGVVLRCEASCYEDPALKCVQVVKYDNCQECPTAKCVEDNKATDAQAQASSKSGGPNIGGIVGGVVGGVALIAIATYLTWRFCIKNKRQASRPDSYNDGAPEKTGTAHDFDSRRDNRSSMHTVHSIASTVLTRASNIIQIAYIPGVTNRATPTSPTVLVPPVPPIPIAISGTNGGSSTDSTYGEQHFFMPGDLRDSTYSAMTGYTDRTSFARTSYAPRSSVASTLYGKNVVVATSQTGMRAKPAVVSVKTVGAGGVAPPVPAVDYERFGRPKSRDSTFSVGSTFLNNASASTATAATARIIRVGSGRKKTVGSGSKLSQEESAAPDSPAPTTASAGLSMSSGVPTVVEETGSEGPFSDPPTLSTRKSTSSLSAVIEDATRRAAQIQKPKRISRDSSPFSDEHATKE